MFAAHVVSLVYLETSCIFFSYATTGRGQSGAETEGQEAAAMEGGGEDMMRQMMGEFGKMGEKEVRLAPTCIMVVCFPDKCSTRNDC